MHRFSQARKRSFRRAQARAFRDGSTWYRGRKHTLASLSAKTLTRSLPSSPEPAPVRRLSGQLQRPNFGILSWNCGGLHAVRYQELLNWITSSHSQPAPITEMDQYQDHIHTHLVCVQETHWPDSCEYQNPAWTFVHSGSGTSEAGVLFAVSKRLVHSSQVRYTELIPGRVVHLRLETQPPIDVLGIYQKAWNEHSVQAREAEQGAHAALIQQRAVIWQTIRRWLHSIPARNALYLMGDMNCTLQPLAPRVGQGVAPGHKPHPDQSAFVSLLKDFGLIALNTWGKVGPHSTTFLQPPRSGVQLDYICARLPGTPIARAATGLPLAPVVHPTGLRHVPIAAQVPKPMVPQSTPRARFTPTQIRQTLAATPDLPNTFLTLLETEQTDQQDLDSCIRQAWTKATQLARVVKQPQTTPEPPDTSTAPTLKQLWHYKRQLRQAQEQCSSFLAPLVSMFSDSTPHNTWLLFAVWRHSRQFEVCNKALRARARANKLAKIDSLIAQTTSAAKAGFTGLHQLINFMRPKSPKRSIHFRRPDGSLMTQAEEHQHTVDFFTNLYAAADHRPEQWSLAEAFCITLGEANRAIRALSARKALPRHHMPAILWRLAEDVLAGKVCDRLNAHLQPGTLHLPHDVLRSYLILLAKPGKPPCKPGNLRPINLLPAEAKILARVAAERLRPYLTAALHRIPQFAYASGRQTGDALERVLAHCQRVRSTIQSYKHDIFDKHSGRKPSGFCGGLQLSRDLKQAFDRIPRAQLQASLTALSLPQDLISLILHIHDRAEVVLDGPGGQQTVTMHRGIRQGCGLAPLLWLAYTIAVHHQLSSYLPTDALTEYADDFHVQWEFTHPRDFKKACQQLQRVLMDLKEMGMLVSTEKTVVLLAMKGPEAARLFADFVVRKGNERMLRLRGPLGTLHLPIRHSHTYLGMKIGYTTFERASMQLRVSQSWTAFHRLHPFLKNNTIPLHKRLQLWQSGVWSVISYGLTAVGVDQVSARLLNQAVAKQLRMVARSPAHVQHETTMALLARLHMESPMQLLDRLGLGRSQHGRPQVRHLQPPHVQQWWSFVQASFRQPEHQIDETSAESRAVLTEVTHIQRLRCACPICSQEFPSTHALSVHMGKKHPESRPAKTSNTTLKNARKDEFRHHAAHGLPECKHCGKRFYGWPQFMGHFSQHACPVLFKRHLDVHHKAPTQLEPQGPTESAQGAFAPGLSTDPDTKAVEAEPVPAFANPSFIALAVKGDLHGLAAAIRSVNRNNYCPQCNQWVASPSYVARHACKMHSNILAVQPLVLQWTKNRGRLSSPCEWCHQRYDRATAHLQACPVLWVCAHMLHQHNTLTDRSQTTLQDVFGRRRAPRRSPPRADAVCRLHEGTEDRQSDLRRSASDPEWGNHAASSDGCGPLQAPAGARANPRPPKGWTPRRQAQHP